MTKSLLAEYEERRKAIYKVCMAKGGEHFSWYEYNSKVKELKKEMEAKLDVKRKSQEVP